MQIVMFRLWRDLHFNDFGKFYYAAQRWREGASSSGPTLAPLMPLDGGRAEHFWNLNPRIFTVYLAAARPAYPGLRTLCGSL